MRIRNSAAKSSSVVACDCAGPSYQACRIAHQEDSVPEEGPHLIGTHATALDNYVAVNPNQPRLDEEDGKIY